MASDLTELEQSAGSIRVLREHEQGLEEANEQLQIQAEELEAQTEELRAQTEELHAQTAELTHTNAALQESEERLALALSGTRVGMYQRDLDSGEGRCTEYLATLLGLRPTTTTTTTTTTTLSRHYHYHEWRRRVHPEDLPRVEAELDRCAAERVPYEQDYRVVWPDGSVHWVTDRGVFQYESDGRCTRILGIVMDITERKQIEKALRESEERMRHIARVGRIGFVEWNAARGTGYWSREHHEIFGYEPGTPMSWEQWLAGVHPEDRARVMANAARLLDRGRSEGQVREHRDEYRFIRPDGNMVWIEADMSVDMVGSEPIIRGSVRDITDRKRMEEALRDGNATLEGKVTQRTAQLQQRTQQLQKLTLEMSEAEERERKRLAEILHDDLQQIIAGAKFHVNLIKSRARYDPSLQQIAVQIDQLLKEAIDKSRSLSHELSPAVLHEEEFTETLGRLVHQMRAKHGFVVRVYATDEVYLQSDAIKALLYRMIQELLFNAVKHAQVHEARVRIRRRGACICVSVSDRGRGFDPQALRETMGFGLLSIRERIELLGGRMKIRSAQGRGSTFFLAVTDDAADRKC